MVHLHQEFNEEVLDPFHHHPYRPISTKRNLLHLILIPNLDIILVDMTVILIPILMPIPNIIPTLHPKLKPKPKPKSIHSPITHNPIMPYHHYLHIRHNSTGCLTRECTNEVIRTHPITVVARQTEDTLETLKDERCLLRFGDDKHERGVLIFPIIIPLLLRHLLV